MIGFRTVCGARCLLTLALWVKKSGRSSLGYEQWLNQSSLKQLLLRILDKNDYIQEWHWFGDVWSGIVDHSLQVMARLVLPGSPFKFQTLEHGQDPSQDLTWLFFGYNPKANKWAYVGNYDRHPRIVSLVEHARILLAGMTMLDTKSWTPQERTCFRGFQTYLDTILHHQHPTTSLVAHAFLKELSFNQGRQVSAWAEPAYTDLDQLWSAAEDALSGVQTFIMQHGINAALHDHPCDFRKAPTTSHSTQMQVKVTLEERNKTMSRHCNVCFSFVVPTRLLQHRVFGGWLCRSQWRPWSPCNLRPSGTSRS